MTALRTLALLFVVLVWPATGWSASEAEEIQSELSSQFEGTFQWDKSAVVEYVSVSLRDIRVNYNGKIIAVGKGQYTLNERVTDINVKWLIDPKNKRFEMWESNPSTSDFVTNGSHAGFISGDLQSIRATWTTRSTGEQGTLLLRAR